MKILFVLDQYFDANNGFTITARRFADVLRQHGHEVRIACALGDNMTTEPDAYIMEKQYIPVFDALVSSQGMKFAKTDREKLREAIMWSDVVHFIAPFALTHNGIKIARELGKPYTGAFHVQPENITSSIHMGNIKAVNTGIYKWFNHYIYKYCTHIHCPSEFIAGELRKNGYKGELHVISNGIDPYFANYHKLPKPNAYKDRFVILMTGRMSVEKRQDVLIKACAMSKYHDRIKLMLAGKGPWKKYLVSLAKAKNVDVDIRFYSKEELYKLIGISDLYVHSSDMEIEAMSCMEAFAGGLVPVISDSARSATPQFALDDRSLFTAGDSAALAEKIDYWIEHPSEKADMEYQYARLAEKYNLDRCVCKAEEMFEKAIDEVRYGEQRRA